MAATPSLFPAALTRPLHHAGHDAGHHPSCGTSDRSGYQPRRPEKTVLYQVVQQNIETLWAEAEAQSPYGMGYPAHVKREFERYLSCGQFCCG
jgi:hypothetical protein